ncbi:hypothetical protein D3C81_2221590 [compost metagenome]
MASSESRVAKSISVTGLPLTITDGASGALGASISTSVYLYGAHSERLFTVSRIS